MAEADRDTGGGIHRRSEERIGTSSLVAIGDMHHPTGVDDDTREVMSDDRKLSTLVGVPQGLDRRAEIVERNDFLVLSESGQAGNVTSVGDCLAQQRNVDGGAWGVVGEQGRRGDQHCYLHIECVGQSNESRPSGGVLASLLQSGDHVDGHA